MPTSTTDGAAPQADLLFQQAAARQELQNRDREMEALRAQVAEVTAQLQQQVLDAQKEEAVWQQKLQAQEECTSDKELYTRELQTHYEAQLKASKGNLDEAMKLSEDAIEERSRLQAELKTKDTEMQWFRQQLLAKEERITTTISDLVSALEQLETVGRYRWVSR